MSTKKVKVLITGIGGFCGSHLAESLLECGRGVVGVERAEADTGHLRGILDQVGLYRLDLCDGGEVRRLLAEVRPDQVYHLAALAAPGPAGGWREVCEVNVYGTIHLLEAVLAEGLGCSVLIAGSSAQYGMVRPEENPVCETNPLRPVSHYGVSKVAQDLLGYRYWATAGLHIVRTRAFNIIGPRQGLQLVGSAMARQVAEIEQGLKEPRVEVGNLAAQRDFVDVRDVAQAYRLALEQGEAGQVYNVCSGQARRISSLLEGLLALSTVQGIEVRQDPARLQSADVPFQVGDYSRLRLRTGWQPRIPFEQTLRDLLDYWRERVAGEKKP